MTLRRIAGSLLLVLLAVCLDAPALAQDERCGAGRDLVVQALERIAPGASDGAFADALELLKHAVSLCSDLGDAWYYRSLVEQHLGHAALAAYALDKARFNNSEALAQQLNPLLLATPAARGLGVAAQPQPSAAAAAPQTPGPVQNKWALVVGISRFQDRNIPALNYTTSDAGSFAAQLKDPAIGRFPPENVHLLTDSEATTRNIKEQLNWIARHAGPNDLVVIYLATHGSPREVDSVGGVNYLVTYDTEIHSADSPDEDALYATALPMIDLVNAVATRMRALRTAVILDTCFSGGAVKNASRLMGAGLANVAPSQRTLDRMAAGTGRIILAASSSDEESLESDQLHHGYFTWFLLQALHQQSGLLPLSQVYASVAKNVSARVAADGASEGLHQHPVLSRSSDDADFALGVAPAAP